LKHFKKYLLFFVFAVVCLIHSCKYQNSDHSTSRSYIDSCGRIVDIPDTLKSVIALKSGALRLLCYMDLEERVRYVEGNEKRRSVPYLFANPELQELPVIGTGNNHDPEMLAASSADLIVVTFMTCGEADKLQAVTKKPVFVLDYGNLGEGKEHLYNSLSLLGEIFNRKGRADSVINYFESTITEIRSRTGVSDKSVVTAYIGGVAFSGSHGITSTVPDYPPFKIASVANVAESMTEILDNAGASQSNTVFIVDTEQLIKWNPEYIFLDAAGKVLWQNEIDRPVLSRTLNALQNLKAYTLLPYNWYSINYENLLCNAWFVGKTIHPEAFLDIDPEMKCREIYSFILGSDIYDDMKDMYNPFRPSI